MFNETNDNHIQAKEPANIHKSFWGNVLGDINNATKAVTNEVKQVTVAIGKTEATALTITGHEISHVTKLAYNKAIHETKLVGSEISHTAKLVYGKVIHTAEKAVSNEELGLKIAGHEISHTAKFVYGKAIHETKLAASEISHTAKLVSREIHHDAKITGQEISHAAKVTGQDLEKAGHVTSIILAGAGKEIIDHPLVITKDIALGLAVGAVVSVAPVVGLVFLGLGLASVIENRKKLVDNALALKSSIGIEYNPAGTSLAQQNEAKQCLEDFGSGSAQLAAGLAGGITGAKFGGPILENITQSLLSKLPPEISTTLEFASLAKFTNQITTEENMPITVTQETPAVTSSNVETATPITLTPDSETIDPTSIAKEPIKAIKLINKINKTYRDINEKADPHYKLASKHLTPIQVLKIFDFSHHSSAFLTSSALGLNSNYIN